MKNSDFIIECLLNVGINDMFGYPGATICHLMDSAKKRSEMKLHLNYHEQASAFSACGYGLSGGIGVAYANGGPGATNLYTGIANAWYDSIPSIFLIGQGDNESLKGNLPIKQRGIQEIPISRLMRDISKKSYKVDKSEELPYYLEKAIYESTEGRPGPIVLELPADVQRANVDIEKCHHFKPPLTCSDIKLPENVVDIILKSKRPCIIAGNGIKLSRMESLFLKMLERCNIPVLLTLPAIDLLPHDHALNYGLIGNNGNRYSNIILSKSDCIISLGSRLDLKQVSTNRSLFAPEATLIRVDIDRGELEYKVNERELQINANLKTVIPYISDIIFKLHRNDWVEYCSSLRSLLYGYDFKDYHHLIQALTEKAPDCCIFTVDVGHHQLYVAQSIRMKKGQKILMSLGLASMGFSLPAAIGAYYKTKLPVICFAGDGGIQMNIQELQTIKRDNIPIKVVIVNNNALGMIREFQERNFNSVYTQSTPDNDYTIPSFEKISYAYGLNYSAISTLEDLDTIDLTTNTPEVIEMFIKEKTYLYPRFVKNRDLSTMDPPLSDIYTTKIKEMGRDFLV